MRVSAFVPALASVPVSLAPPAFSRLVRFSLFFIIASRQSPVLRGPGPKRLRPSLASSREHSPALFRLGRPTHLAAEILLNSIHLGRRLFRGTFHATVYLPAPIRSARRSRVLSDPASRNRCSRAAPGTDIPVRSMSSRTRRRLLAPVAREAKFRKADGG